MTKLFRNILFIGALLALSACQPTPEITVSVRECASLPGKGRASACVAVLDGKAYVFAGREKGNVYLNDLWVYDAAADTWTNLGATPLKKRVNASLVACDGILYAGLGYAGTGVYGDSACLRDWWSYDPSTAQWTALATYPNKQSVAAVGLVQDRQIYMLYGFGHVYSRNVCVYSPDSNRWTTRTDNPKRPRIRFGGKGVMHGGRAYYGTGYCNDGSLRDWYEVDLATDTWTGRKAIPGKGREFAACANNNEYIYLFGGRNFAGDMTGGEVMNTFMRYSPDKDEWTMCGTMPHRMENGIAFTIDGRVYFGLGEDENGQPLTNLYCVDD
ncbi:MAG: hypothetical protein IJS82_06815 [Paludibacteraceae bacterium]|nr:hypothetical protein [Paludibacteraceae bacterium]